MFSNDNKTKTLNNITIYTITENFIKGKLTRLDQTLNENVKYLRRT